MKIRVTCPACQDTLEVDEGLVGKEVECGSCLQPFTVEDPNAKKPKKYKMRRSESEDDGEDRKRPPGFKGRPRRQRDEDDEDDYDRDADRYEPPPRPFGSRIASVTLGTAALLTGLVALVGACCAPVGIGLGITAMVLAAKARRDPAGRAFAVVGSILGSLAVIGSISFTVWLVQGGINHFR